MSIIFIKGGKTKNRLSGITLKAVRNNGVPEKPFIPMLTALQFVYVFDVENPTDSPFHEISFFLNA